MREYKIAAIPADGIGPEVIAAGLQALEALQQRSGEFKLSVQHFDWGSDYYKAHGRMMPADGLETLKRFDAIYFGAVGAPDVPDHITLWGLRLPICQGSTNTPTCGRPGSCRASPRRSPALARAISTG
jgi:tartrate dehydrogenase/decarboxylase / D-malate dehydrogenase